MFSIVFIIFFKLSIKNQVFIWKIFDYPMDICFISVNDFYTKQYVLINGGQKTT